MKAHDLFHAGKLDEAIAAQVEEVRGNPTDANRRLFLCELLCFTGDLERADKQLDALGHQDPKALPWVAAFRHLIRAEQARQDFYASGRLPEFLGRPEGSTRLQVEASIRVREGSTAEAGEILERAEAERVKPSGTCNDVAFTDFRDLDDLISGVLEVLTSAGKYYWIPLEMVESIEFREPERARDLIWRPTHLIVRDGPDGEVFLPVLYPGSAASTDPAIRLGRSTDWTGGEGEPVRGIGQRTFLAGEEAVPILEIQSVEFGPRTEA